MTDAQLLDRCISTLDTLIAYPTVSCDSNLELIAHAAQLLEDCGAHVELWHDATGKKANLFGTLGPQTDGGIVLSGHTDVVPVKGQPWSSDPFKMRQEDGLLYGRGTCDMKGFVAAALAIAPELKGQTLKRPLHFAFTYDEEIGCLGGKQLVKDLQARSIRPSVAIVGEPTSMGVIDAHKGGRQTCTSFTGLAGHSSAPSKGVNAVEYAVRYVSHLMQVRDQLIARAPADSRFEPPHSTINVGQMHGGVANNVIPDHASVNWDFRSVQPSDLTFVDELLNTYVNNELLPAMRAVHPDAKIDSLVLGEINGLQAVDKNEARDIVSALTGGNSVDAVAYGTEAGSFQEIGLDVVVCGPGSIEQAHKADEFVSVKQLGACMNMLQGLQRQLVA